MLKTLNVAKACAFTAVISAVVSGIVVWNVQAYRYEAKEADRLEQVRVKTEENRVNTTVAAVALESDKKEIEVRYKTLTKVVTKIVDRPVYLNTCLDDEGIAAINGVAK